MRVYIHLPDSLLDKLQDEARAAHRPPRYHLEWLIRIALEKPAPSVLPAPQIQAQEITHVE
jgi:hypothetical protein